MLWTLTAASGRLESETNWWSWSEKTKQIWESTITWNSPIYSWAMTWQKKKKGMWINENIRDIGGEAERDMEGWGDAAEQSNSCWASHLLQVESSANRQTGTDPLRQAPGRARDGQRKNGTKGGGWGEARRRSDERETIKKDWERKKRETAQKQKEPLQPVTLFLLTEVVE